MAAKENLRVRLARMRAETGAAGRSVPAMPTLRGAEAASYFLLAAVLAGGQIFDGYAPFGVALVGGAGSGANAAAALLGAGLGYLTLHGFVEGLRYVSAAILTFSVAFAFYDTRLYKRPWTMPLTAAAMNGCTGMVYLTQQGWGTVDVIRFLLEILLTAACTYGFRAALTGGRNWQRPEQWVGGSLLLAAVLVTLSGCSLFAGVALGPLLAAAAVLACAWQAGAGVGAAAGVGLGLAMDLAKQGIPLYAMAFGAAGLVAGLIRGSRRVTAALAFVLANAAAVLWIGESGQTGTVLCQVFGAALLFLLVPERGLRMLGAQLVREERRGTDDRCREYVRLRLEAGAQAFRAVYESLCGLFAAERTNDSDAAAVFDRTADRVCRRCTLRDTCWDRDYVTTFNALNDATQAMMDRGRGEAGDFPPHFSSRCIRFPAFLAAVNEELTALLHRRQYSSRIRDSRQAVCRQYAQMSELLSRAAEELGQELTPDPARERRLRQHLAALKLEGETAVFYDRDHHLRAEITGPACRRLSRPQELKQLMELMDLPMRQEATQRSDHLVLVQAEPLRAVAGVAARKKDGEPVSGDSGTWFRRPDGRLYVLLCDGMGSGTAANRESGLAVRLLEQFLRAGVETEHALVILNSALGLRGEEEGGFTTVDLLEVDLFSGHSAVFKFGAAPTYIRKGKSVQRIAGSSLPAGMAIRGELRPDCTRFRLEPEDCVLLISDGVCSGQEDEWVRRQLEEFDTGSPKDLARALIRGGPEGGAADDRTALVVQLTRR